MYSKSENIFSFKGTLFVCFSFFFSFVLSLFLSFFLIWAVHSGLPLFDHLRSVFFSQLHIYVTSFCSISYYSNFYLCSLSLLDVRFAVAFCFSASSSSFLKIHKEKKSAGLEPRTLGITIQCHNH